MSFEERLEAVKAKREAVRARNDEMVKIIRDSIDAGDEKFAEDLKNLKWAFGEVSAELDDQADAIDEKIEEKIDAAEDRRENIRAKIAGIKTEIEKADREDFIVDLLIYAEECAEIAAYYSKEADYAMAVAEEQIKIYNEKFGE